MKKEENKQLAVIPTEELLSELESMVVFGGIGIVDAEEDIYNNCNFASNCGVKCSDSCNPKITSACNVYYNATCVPKTLTCIDIGTKQKIPCN